MIFVSVDLLVRTTRRSYIRSVTDGCTMSPDLLSQLQATLGEVSCDRSRLEPVDDVRLL